MSFIAIFFFASTLLETADAMPTKGIRHAMEKTIVPEFEHTKLLEVYQGTMGAYHTPKELHTLMKMLLAEFPEAIRPVHVGKTYENKTIHGFAVGLDLNGTNGTNWTQNALERPAILLTGAHHARELTSIEMSYYTMLRLLFDYVHGDKQAIQILKDSVIFVIPVVNVDSFDAIATHFNKTKQLVAIRKNRH